MAEDLTEIDYVKGGYFDQKADAMLKVLFEVEPYKTYQDYFKVYKLAVVPSTGYFQSETALAQALRIPGITEEALRHTGILVLTQDISASCYIWANGQSVAFTTVDAYTSAAHEL